MSNADRFIALEARAASGDRKAARDLIEGGWWPGDPNNAKTVDKVMRDAVDRKAEATDRARRMILTSLTTHEATENFVAVRLGHPRPYVTYRVQETTSGRFVARATASSSAEAIAKVARAFVLDEATLNAAPMPTAATD